jgi:very-short-patch-repair endonuclease
MRQISSELRRLGGVANLASLVSADLTKRAIQRAAARGEITRVRRGWYSNVGADKDTVRAVRVGGRLACVSACRKYGIWTPVDTRLHVSVTPQSNNHKNPDDPHRVRQRSDGTVVHWGCSDPDLSARAKLPDLLTALLEVVSCQPPEFAFAMVESAISRGLLSEFDRWELYWRAPIRCRALISQAGADSGSGTESVFAFRTRCLGVSFRQQVEVDGVGRVDFVIGDRLIVEIDSEGHHGNSAQRRRDLARDAIAAALGFITLRFDYWQVIEDWETVESAILASVARGDHLAGARG